MIGSCFVPLFCLLLAVQASANVQVGFLEIRRPDGSLVLLEPNGRFAHVALRIGSRWLHSHPQNGVEWVDEVEMRRIGQVTAVQNISYPPFNPQDLESLVGRPYDFAYSWTDLAFYCSELVGKLLGLEPKPMFFDPHLWPPAFSHLNGQPGLSPDGIAKALGVPLKGKP